MQDGKEGEHDIGRIEEARLAEIHQGDADALHRTNGGYLILDARKALTEPFVWEALKRALDNKKAAITTAADESVSALGEDE